MAIYDYSPDGRKIAHTRDVCPVTMQFDHWLEARSFRLTSLPEQALTLDQVTQAILNGFRLNDSVFLLPPGTSL